MNPCTASNPPAPCVPEDVSSISTEEINEMGKFHRQYNVAHNTWHNIIITHLSVWWAVYIKHLNSILIHAAGKYLEGWEHRNFPPLRLTPHSKNMYIENSGLVHSLNSQFKVPSGTQSTCTCILSTYIAFNGCVQSRLKKLGMGLGMRLSVLKYWSMSDFPSILKYSMY
jgi:hypothetical protein